ncbi:hypothetical protein ACVI1I_006323 [Bradyrhizobium sp. USDA 4459]
MRVLAVLSFVLMGLVSPAHAWWDMGHMEVAAIAYGRLDDTLRPKVDTLVKPIRPIRCGSRALRACRTATKLRRLSCMPPLGPTT